MPNKRFRVTIYDVEAESKSERRPAVPFEEAIRKTYAESVEDREQTISAKLRRLEHFRSDKPVCFANLITFEFSGPGRVKRGERTRAIPMDEDEFFYPETALLYDPDSQLAFVESSQSMTTGPIARYFAKFANGTKYTFTPRVDADAAARARAFVAFRSVNMRMSLGPITDQDRELGLAPIKELLGDFEGGYIDVTLKTQRERDRSLAPNVIQRLIDAVRENQGPPVEKLEISGRPYEEDPAQFIDIFQHREKRDRDLPIDDETRNIPHRLRWESLHDTWREFDAR